MIRTGGKWNPKEENVYFIAADTGSLSAASVAHKHLLIAVNELRSQATLDDVGVLLDNEAKLLIDSGVFSLAMRHAEKHGITMDKALGYAPAEVDGFEELFAQYIGLLKQIGRKVWGYIEIDQGGRENKIKTRAKLEALGLKPIPVYHPFVDGWDYFDYLAERYDRICFGNVVLADQATRKRLLATAWERRQKYPNLWIHMLGLTPGAHCNAYPINSCDSSTWLALVRWPGAYRARNAMQPFSTMPLNMTYRLGAHSDSEHGNRKARALGGYESQMLMRNWRALQKDVRRALSLGKAS